MQIIANTISDKEYISIQKIVRNCMLQLPEIFYAGSL